MQWTSLHSFLPPLNSRKKCVYIPLFYFLIFLRQAVTLASIPAFTRKPLRTCTTHIPGSYDKAWCIRSVLCLSFLAPWVTQGIISQPEHLPGCCRFNISWEGSYLLVCQQMAGLSEPGKGQPATFDGKYKDGRVEPWLQHWCGAFEPANAWFPGGYVCDLCTNKKENTMLGKLSL